jgi:hypothetical protein
MRFDWPNKEKETSIVESIIMKGFMGGQLKFQRNLRKENDLSKGLSGKFGN